MIQYHKMPPQIIAASLKHITTCLVLPPVLPPLPTQSKAIHHSHEPHHYNNTEKGLPVRQPTRRLPAPRTGQASL